MREEAIQSVTQQLGQPSSVTEKVLRWNVKPGLDVVVQRDGSSDRGVVWMPWPCGDSVCPSHGEVYPASRGRHSNTYCAASLARGKAALKWTVDNPVSLSALVRFLKMATDNSSEHLIDTTVETPPAPQSIQSAPVQPARAAEPLSAPSQDHDPEEVTGLVVQSPWIDLILRGEKTWEIRTRHASRRGRIALIKSKSGRVFGTCRVVDCLGPLSMDQMLANSDKHCVPAEMLAKYCRPDQTYAWVLADPQPFAEPIPYRHPSGAVIWVRLTHDNVPQWFDGLAAATHSAPQGKRR